MIYLKRFVRKHNCYPQPVNKMCTKSKKENHYSSYYHSQQRSPTPDRWSRHNMHDMEQAKHFEYDTAEIIRKGNFISSSYKDRNTKNNDMLYG